MLNGSRDAWAILHAGASLIFDVYDLNWGLPELDMAELLR